jgi:DNA mismatch endonuclease (patch repair protein)
MPLPPAYRAMDKITPERRSANMANIRSANTKPELKVRRIAHRLGFRFRLNRRDLAGRPDLVFVARKKIVFVHGCYWHGHGCKIGGTGAKSNQAYWGPKIARNRERDDSAVEALTGLGWKVLIIWECETRDESQLASMLEHFLR